MKSLNLESLESINGGQSWTRHFPSRACFSAALGTIGLITSIAGLTVATGGVALAISGAGVLVSGGSVTLSLWDGDPCG